jgi:putative transposase
MEKVSITKLSSALGISKQAFYKMAKRDRLYEAIGNEVIQEVLKLRVDHPTMGMRDMYRLINPSGVGRDKFCELCKRYNLGSKRHKNYRRTTDSSGVKRFENLTNNLICTDINQVWVSDITYYEALGRFYYITFVMDAYSRQILGYSLSQDLKMVNTTKPALCMALKNRKNFNLAGLIFHSDGGGQYYADEFLRLTEMYGIRNSMCEYAWENAKAERINGVIKNNYLRYFKQRTRKELHASVGRAVTLYNEEKPHCALSFMSPVDFEMSALSLTQPTKPKMTESLDASAALKGH